MMKISKRRNNETYSILMVTGILTLLACSSTVVGQSETGEQKDYTAVAGSVDYHVVGQDRTVRFVTSELSFHGDVVKNAPYSAEAVTTVTQTLADGNRISRETTAVLYRDSEGRTRREQTITGIGPWAWVSEGQVLQVIVINDPVSGVSYTLNPSTRTAVIHDISHFTSSPMPGETEEPTEVPGRMLAQYQRAEMNEIELLGTRTIEGVVAEGTRSTLTLPAGSIGNERPIDVVSERWYSSELHTLVLSNHSDPRFGQTVFQLRNISLAEPMSGLFEVPSDYEIAEPNSLIFEATPLMP